MNTQDFYALATLSKLCCEIGVGTDMVVEISRYYMSLKLFGYSLYLNWDPNEAPMHICHLDTEMFHHVPNTLLTDALYALEDQSIIAGRDWDPVDAFNFNYKFDSVKINIHNEEEPKWYSVKALELLNLLMNNQLTSSVYPFNNCTNEFSFILVKEFKH